MLTSCTTQTWVAADMQLDITGSNFQDTDRARVCVEGFGMREVALGTGHIAFTGLPSDTDISVVVDIIGYESMDSAVSEASLRNGRAGPIELGPEQLWLETEWEPCADENSCEICQTPGKPSVTNTNSTMLAIRFL